MSAGWKAGESATKKGAARAAPSLVTWAVRGPGFVRETLYCCAGCAGIICAQAFGSKKLNGIPPAAAVAVGIV